MKTTKIWIGKKNPLIIIRDYCTWQRMTVSRTYTFYASSQAIDWLEREMLALAKLRDEKSR